MDIYFLIALQKNQKLVSRGPYINIEIESIIPEALRRWHRQDNRNETLKKINVIVNSAIKFIEDIEIKIEERRRKQNDHFDIESDDPLFINRVNMLDCLDKSLPGIFNLKETYATCTQTCARIDIILKKIQDCLHTNAKYLNKNNE